jgi:hypothetical protein
MLMADASLMLKLFLGLNGFAVSEPAAFYGLTPVWKFLCFYG